MRSELEYIADRIEERANECLGRCGKSDEFRMGFLRDADKLRTLASTAAPAAHGGEAVAWSVLDRRTGKHWYTNESPFTSQYYANQYSHLEADGEPSMKIVPLYTAPQKARAEGVVIRVGGLEWNSRLHEPEDLEHMLTLAQSPASPEPHAAAVPQGLCDPVPGARFGHHPDPATDFCIEVETLQGRLFNARHGITMIRRLAQPAGEVDEAVKPWTDEQCAEFMAVGLRHVQYKRGTEGPTITEIRQGQMRAEALRPATNDQVKP